MQSSFFWTQNHYKTFEPQPIVVIYFKHNNIFNRDNGENENA
jgi:hypothetical protein